MTGPPVFSFLPPLLSSTPRDNGRLDLTHKLTFRLPLTSIRVERPGKITLFLDQFIPFCLLTPTVDLHHCPLQGPVFPRFPSLKEVKNKRRQKYVLLLE